jgi:putative phosphoribosyl transferase
MLSPVLFQDRSAAGEQLAQKLLHLKDRDPVVLALPRGGVPVAVAIAEALHAPLDLLLVRKIGVPWQPELAAGAILDGKHPQVVINDEIVRQAGVSQSDIQRIAAAELGEIERRRDLWLGGRSRIAIAGRTAIIVDDGIATGASVRVALEAVRSEKAAHIVLAVPVAPAETLRSLRKSADEIVCVAAPPDFRAVGAYYRDFRQLEDKDVQELLARIPQGPQKT